MVKRFLSLLHKEFSGITEAAFLLAGFAFISQILGFVRDRALAHTLGASPTLDVYYAAFRIPDLLFNSISTMVSITVLIPFVIERMGNGDGENISKARKFLSEVFSSFLAIMVLVSITLFIFMPKLALLVAPGFTIDQMASMISTSRMMLLSPIFFGLSNLFGTITQLYRRFFVYALAPVLYNMGIIAGIYFFFPYYGIMGLGIGVVIGAALHALIQIPVLIKHKFLPYFTRTFVWSDIKKVFYLSLPRTLGLSLNSFAILTIISMASTLKAGSISIFSFAYNLQAVPIAIIGVSYSVAAFPTLAKAFNGGQIDEFKKLIITAIRQVLFWSAPVVALFVVLRAQIVRVILGTGQFSWSDTKLTAAALALFSLAVIAQSLIILLTRGYYAAGKTQRPLVINVIFTVSEIFFAYLFLWLYQHNPSMQYFFQSLLRVEDVIGTEILMLPLGYAVGILLNFLGLWIIFKKDFLNGEKCDVAKAFFQSVSASLILGFVAYKFLGLLDNVFDINTFWGILGQGFFAGVLGLTSWAAILWLLNNREFAEIGVTLRKKIWKEPAIVPSQENLQ